MYFKTPIIKILSKHSSFESDTKSVCILFYMITYTTKFDISFRQSTTSMYMLDLWICIHTKPNWVIMIWVFVTPHLECQMFCGAK